MNKKNIATIISATSMLTACGGGSSENNNNSSVNEEGIYIYTKPANKNEAARFLLQAQFDTNLNEINALLDSTYQDYLNTQFNSPISMTAWEWLNSKGYNVIDTNAYFDQHYPGDYVLWQQLITSKDNFRKKIALALSEIFVVSLSGLNMLWRGHAIASWWDMLNAKCFTTFRELLGAITLHPAMGNYLNLAGSKKENSEGRQPDENYAREIMQLFSIGLYELNIDGTEKIDANGNKIETYSQEDITNLARALTGWNYDQSQNTPTNIVINHVNRNVSNTYYTRLPLIFNEEDHSTKTATFLGVTLPINGIAALNAALDTIANHPNVAPFFCKQLIKKLITSNPSPEYVARVANIFNNNGSGIRGDLKAVITAIYLDPEARDPANMSVATFGKLKEPMHRFIQWARTFKVSSKYGYWKIGDKTEDLCQSPLRSPSVFNFFRPNYVPPSTQLAKLNLTAPEFQIVNESTVSSYINFMQNILKFGIYVNAPDIPNIGHTDKNGYDITPDYTEALTYVTDSISLVNYLDLILNYGQTSYTNKQLIVSAIDSFGITSKSNSSISLQLDKLAAAILLIMSNTDYIVQK
jgi:uncharacterized protein (DUF1800 family)